MLVLQSRPRMRARLLGHGFAFFHEVFEPRQQGSTGTGAGSEMIAGYGAVA